MTCTLTVFRSFLFFTFRVTLRVLDDYDFVDIDLEEYPDIDGNYEKIPNEFRDERPVWRHTAAQYYLRYFSRITTMKNIFRNIFR